MGITEIIVYSLIILISAAFIIRVLIESWKIIYAMAPIIIGIILCLFFINILGNIDKEMEGKNANHIESIEDSSGHSRY